jgi:hypothetical protein
MKYFGSPNLNQDIVISRGLRFNDQTTNLVIQKPGEADGRSGKIAIPYGTDLTNLGTGLTVESESGGGRGGSSTGLTVEDINAINPYLESIKQK